MWNSNLWSANLHLSVCFLLGPRPLAGWGLQDRVDSLAKNTMPSFENEVLLDFGIWTLVNSLIYDLHLLVFILRERELSWNCRNAHCLFASPFWICAGRSNTFTSPFLYTSTASCGSPTTIPFQGETVYKSGFFIMSNHLKHNLKQWLEIPGPRPACTHPNAILPLNGLWRQKQNVTGHPVYIMGVLCVYAAAAQY